MMNTPSSIQRYPDSAALAMLLERAANVLDSKAAGFEWDVQYRALSPEVKIGTRNDAAQLRTDAAALRVWALLLVAAVEWAEARGAWLGSDEPPDSDEDLRLRITEDDAYIRYCVARMSYAEGERAQDGC